jgi:surface protein
MMIENVALKTTTICDGSERFTPHSWAISAYKIVFLLTFMISCATTDAIGIDSSGLRAKSVDDSLATMRMSYTSCADVLQHIPDALSGTYPINLTTNETADLFCDFNEDPVRAFLGAHNPEENAGIAIGTGCDHRMQFSKIGLDLDTLRVDTRDRSFATEAGEDCSSAPAEMALSMLTGCNGNSSSLCASVNLSGTRFAIDKNATSLVCDGGESSDVHLLYLNDDQHAVLSAGMDFCGTCQLSPLVLKLRPLVESDATPRRRLTTGYIFSDKTALQTAVNAWCSNATTASATYGHISTWNVSAVTDMSNLFKDKNTFNDDISSWDVSSVTTMNSMFEGASAFNQDIGSWNVSNVKSMRYMFGFMDFNQNIGFWDVSNVTDMSRMFHVSRSFNQDISSWDVSSVTTLEGMFAVAWAFNQDISAWDVSNVKSMRQLFYWSGLNQDISSWNMSSVEDVYYLFYLSASDIGMCLNLGRSVSLTDIGKNHVLRGPYGSLYVNGNPPSCECPSNVTYMSSQASPGVCAVFAPSETPTTLPSAHPTLRSTYGSAYRTTNGTTHAATYKPTYKPTNRRTIGPANKCFSEE